MAIEVFNRYEKKFLLTQSTYEKFVDMISEKMEADAYSKDGGFYRICNIYYDTPNDELIRKSIDGPVYKEKLRLRSYDTPELSDKVYLEIKKKYNGIVNKRRTTLTLKEAYDYLETGIRPEYKPYMNKQVLDELDYFINHYELVPKVFLSYDRRAYFDKNDRDFRLTFDTNIRCRREDVRLEAGSYGDLLLEDGVWLMEVKILKASPLWFTKILSELKVYPASFSKYGTEYKNMILSREGEKVVCLNQYLQQQPRTVYQPVQQF